MQHERGKCETLRLREDTSHQDVNDWIILKLIFVCFWIGFSWLCSRGSVRCGDFPDHSSFIHFDRYLCLKVASSGSRVALHSLFVFQLQILSCVLALTPRFLCPTESVWRRPSCILLRCFSWTSPSLSLSPPALGWSI